MSKELVVRRHTSHVVELNSSAALPLLVAAAGEDAVTRFVEFFTAHVRNANTRRAYHRNAVSFLDWCADRGLADLRGVKPVVVAAYIEQLMTSHSKPTVKQHLAAVRMLFDWLVIGQVVPTNPAAAVRGPKHVVKRGKTPVLTAEETRTLLDSIDTSTIIGLRDRALIATMVYTFARVGAVVGMRVEDYFPQGRRARLRLSEKGGKQHEMPAHHTLEEYLDAYVESAGIAGETKTPLFRSAPGREKALTGNAMRPADVWRMVRRRAKAAGIWTPIGCHSFRATGITTYLENGGTLEHAQQMAAHESPRTTKLYDRTSDEITLDEVERILI